MKSLSLHLYSLIISSAQHRKSLVLIYFEKNQPEINYNTERSGNDVAGRMFCRVYRSWQNKSNVQ